MSSQTESLLVGEKFRVERVRSTTPSGAKKTRDIVRHPGAVAVVPLLDDGQVCLIQNFRISVNEVLIELPAGTLEPGEEPLHCARRELAEETGYTAGHIEAFGSFFLSPGILDEKMHLFVARDLAAGLPHREVGEEISNLVVSYDEALSMVRDGRIHDAKTIVGLLKYAMLRPAN